MKTVALAIAALAAIEIYHFRDRTVVIYGAADQVRLQIGAPARIIQQRVDANYAAPLFRLPNSKVFHRTDCRYVVDRPDRMQIIEAEKISLKPCFFCKPDL